MIPGAVYLTLTCSEYMCHFVDVMKICDLSCNEVRDHELWKWDCSLLETCVL